MLSSPRQVELISAPEPEPAERQLRVRIEGCGVCGSDLPVWLGRPWFDYPREPGAPGHEAWGVVDAVGPLADGYQVGDRVTGLMYRSYAEYDLADADALVRLPDALAGQPFPGEPLACAINVFRRSGISAGDIVAVIGVGFLGALLVSLAANAGARVIGVSRRESALQTAMEMGAQEAVSTDEDVAARVSQLTEGRMCDVAVEAAGVQSTLDVASGLMRVRGRLVIAGYHQDGPRQVNMQQWNWNGIDVINAHERDQTVYREGLELAVAEVAAGRLDPAPLYTHRFPLEDLDQAFRTMEERPDSFVKGLVLAG